MNMKGEATLSDVLSVKSAMYNTNCDLCSSTFGIHFFNIPVLCSAEVQSKIFICLSFITTNSKCSGFFQNAIF